MSLTLSDVRKIAKLSSIAVDEKEEKKLHQDLLGIFHWIDQLRDVNVDGVDLMEGIDGSLMHERLDCVEKRATPDSILCNAPHKAHTFFCVPKVIE